MPSDLLYGVLSIITQFGGVLRERGREYRGTLEGRVLGAQIERVCRDLGEREKIALGTVLASLDGLSTLLREMEAGVGEANGAGVHAANGNGAPATSGTNGTSGANGANGGANGANGANAYEASLDGANAHRAGNGASRPAHD
ncbi:hypothetical protein FVF58_34725 [Paraburkholderia panacisoli]|uniref:Uncharacterized protein n=1 Tax=Paraburkholderia panacisoli TaxID=2603818 RepID=A0A5B0GPB6_9BURK|nr:hypothetical protein [Paraburkholderia panacisoli]KAA1003840.1 hypothetical protein FVF58_34725 [Paraburkholderia panacisoli]